MDFNQNVAEVHAYLCADGYVIRNPPTQKQKYYHIGLRNTNEEILKHFQKIFTQAFGIVPIITKGKDRCKIQNKNLYFHLTNDFSYYSGEWTLPKLRTEELKLWLRAYFDCDAWVALQKAKSRAIGLESINENGLKQIKAALMKFNIKSSDVKKRKNKNIWYIFICGRDDLTRFRQNVGFFHPQKKKKLDECLNSYETYTWNIPERKAEFAKFVTEKGKIRKPTKQVRFCSVIKANLTNLKKKLQVYDIDAKVYGPWENSSTVYFCLSFHEKDLKKFGGE